MNKNFIKPNKTRNFAKIPNTIEYFLTGNKSLDILPQAILEKFDAKYSKVVLILLDGFGWKYFQKYKNKYPFLKRFVKQKGAHRITSQFPSTTCAELSTINFGSPVEEHGLYEWYTYNKKLESITTPILFGVAGEGRDSLMGKIKPEKLYPQETIYTKLAKHKINSQTIQPYEFHGTTYSKASYKGSTSYGVKTYSEGLLKLAHLINEEKKSSYFYIYIDRIDAMLHEYGENSDYCRNEIHDIFTKLEDIFVKNLKTKNTLLVLTADHGQIMVDRKKTYYLNLKIPQIVKYFKTDKQGEVITPTGSARDVFLHVKEDCLEDAKKILKLKLKNIAEVYTSQELSDEEVFDVETAGNLIILPTGNNTVWWYEKGKFEMQFVGVHGGLTADEMEIPFLLAKI